MRFAFEYRIDTVKMLINVLLQNLSKDYRCKVVSDEEFYKRHGYSKKLLDLVRLDMLRYERLSYVAVFLLPGSLLDVERFGENWDIQLGE
jgi:hypothetical protein